MVVTNYVLTGMILQVRFDVFFKNKHCGLDGVFSIHQEIQPRGWRLRRKGAIFRGQRMVNWSPVLQTAVSDLEVQLR